MDKSYVHLQWDSDFFGFNVAKIDCLDLDSELLLKMFQKLKKNKYRLIYWYVPEEYRSVAAMAQKYGGLLVDEKITYVKKIDRPVSTASPHWLDLASYLSSEPEPAMINLALESGMYSRFRLDPLFPKDLFKKLYTCWVTRAVRREIAWNVFVARDADEIIGFVTLGEKEKRGAIGLMAVAAKSRGRRIGTILIETAEKCFVDHGYVEVQIVTQRANTAACRFYESCNYQIESVDKIFHFWLQ